MTKFPWPRLVLIPISSRLTLFRTISDLYNLYVSFAFVVSRPSYQPHRLEYTPWRSWFYLQSRAPWRSVSYEHERWSDGLFDCFIIAIDLVLLRPICQLIGENRRQLSMQKQKHLQFSTYLPIGNCKTAMVPIRCRTINSINTVALIHFHCYGGNIPPTTVEVHLGHKESWWAISSASCQQRRFHCPIYLPLDWYKPVTRSQAQGNHIHAGLALRFILALVRLSKSNATLLSIRKYIDLIYILMYPSFDSVLFRKQISVKSMENRALS